jgi:hypothetical protein
MILEDGYVKTSFYEPEQEQFKPNMMEYSRDTGKD